MRVLAVMVAVAVVGCTQGAAAESDQVGTESSPITLRSRAQLPDCTAATESLYAYIESEDVVVGCLDGKWQAPPAVTH